MERSSGAAPSPQPGGGGPIDNAPLLTVHVEDSEDGASIVTLSGELDLSTIPRMEPALIEQLRQRRAVLVDLSGLSFIDSSGIGVLLQASREANGIPMHLVIGTGSQVERVFGIVGIHEALPVFPDRADALAAIAANGGAGV